MQDHHDGFSAVSPEEDALSTFLRVLRTAGCSLEPHEILDVLWLATRLPPGALVWELSLPGHSVEAHESRRSTRDTTEEPKRHTIDDGIGEAPRGPTSPPGAEEHRVRLHAAPRPGTTEDRLALPPPPPFKRALPLRVPERKAIPEQLKMSRALRPLKQRRPSSHAREIDESATADALAETRLPDVILRPARERWLNLILVIDDGLSMLLWHRLSNELGKVLQRLGAFRLMRSYGLDTRSPDAPLLRTRPYSTATATLPPSVLDDPSGQTLVIVVSDGMGAAWRDGSLHGVLSRWASTGPVALFHALPPALWGSSGIRAERWQVTTRHRGAANSSWHITDPVLPGELGVFHGVPVPVLEPVPSAAHQWARFLASPGGTVELPLFAQPGGSPSTPPQERGDDLQRFRDAASPEAYRLAAHLAAVAPVSIPVMRLIQSALPWQASTNHLAEVFLGGLLHPAPAPVPGTLPAQHRIFDFSDHIKNTLLDAVPTAELMLTSRRIGRQLEALAGRSPDFPAWLAHPSGHDALPQRQQGFTTIEERLMRRLGIAVQPPRAHEPQPSHSEWAPLTGQDPRQLGPYRLLLRRPEGSTVLYLAETAEGRVILRTVAPGRTTDAARRLVTVEAEVLRRLRGRCAPTLAGTGTDPQRPWTAMSSEWFIDDASAKAQRLSDVLHNIAWRQAETSLDLLTSLTLGWRLARALSLCHFHNVVLGGLSPYGVIVTEREVILDGLTRCIIDDDIDSYTDAGPVPTRTDNIRALGEILGKISAKHTALSPRGRPEEMTLWRSGSWRPLYDLVASCAADDPALRPTAGDVERALARYVSLAAASTTRTPPTPYASRETGSPNLRPQLAAESLAGALPQGSLPSRTRRRVARFRRSHPEIGTRLLHSHRITVVGAHPGSGRATVTITLGSILAAVRGDRVLALDGAPGITDLAGKITDPVEASRYRLATLPTPVTYEQLRSFTSVTRNGLEVLSLAPTRPAASTNFADEYQRIVEHAQHHYSILLTDWAVPYPATRRFGEHETAVLDTTDALVVCCIASRSSTEVALNLLEALDESYPRLASRAHLVLSLIGVPAHESDISRWLPPQHASATVIPYDSRLTAEDKIDIGRLRNDTVQALLSLAAAIAADFPSLPDDFPGSTRPSGP
nr:SAV_2336 N-terminal domain-related protein [Streptomyces carminius]